MMGHSIKLLFVYQCRQHFILIEQRECVGHRQNVICLTRANVISSGGFHVKQNNVRLVLSAKISRFRNNDVAQMMLHHNSEMVQSLLCTVLMQLLV